MASDASAALGAPEIAGAIVQRKGLTKKLAFEGGGRTVGGLVGGVVASAAPSLAGGGVAEVPDFGRAAYLAVTESELALVKIKGAFKAKPSDEVLARVARTEIGAVEFDRGIVLSQLRIAFTNGMAWEFEVPKVGRKAAENVVRALGGPIG